MMMDPAYLSAVAASFQVHGAALEPGLSDSELDQIEQAAGFVFPPDLRQLLQFVLPTGTRVGQFPEWRTDPVRVLERARGYLADGVAFDVENGVVWPTTWGPRPPGVAQAVARARELVAAAPPLIPICTHRFLPAEPPRSGNPVFSVVQTDIIRYGLDLADYLRAEFGAPPQPWAATAARPIRFWDDLL